MIYHFLHRDFLSNKVNWIMNFVIISVCLAGSLVSQEILFILGVVEMFFAILPLQSLTGAAWRSQHVMSRNYLLSLPVDRQKMFLIVQMRALVFAVPVLIYASIMPFFSPFVSTLVLSAGSHFIIYFLMLVMALIWMINSSIYSNLIFEKITTYLTKLERTKAWTFALVVFFFEMGVVICSFLKGGESLVSTCVGFLALLVILAFRFRVTRSAWLGR